VSGARARVNEAYAIYGTLPSYAAMMEREGAKEPADVGLLGTKEHVLEQLHALHEAGVTEFSGAPTGTSQERADAIDALMQYAHHH